MQDVQKIFALRLLPGADLKKTLADFAAQHDIKAGYVITAVGSLTTCNLRYAGQSAGITMHDKFEILALSGTISIHGLHLHVALADGTGKTIGGHLLEGNIIYTTAEIVIGEANNLLFTRIADAETGYPELVIQKRG